MWAALLFNKATAWILVALSLCAGGFAMGWKARKPQVDRAKAALALCEATRSAEQAEAIRCLAETEAYALEAVAKAEQRARDAKATIVYRTKEVIREIPVYITPETDATYPLPRGLICVYNQAVAAGNGASTAPAPCESPSSPAPVTASALAASLTENLSGTCAEWRENALGWERWYAELREGWNTP